jgi:hypothetical protein
MRNLRRALLASGLGFATSFIAACGGGAGLLSGDQANTLQNQLSRVSSALSARKCAAAKAAADRLVEQVAGLPTTITTPLLQDLDLGARTIRQLAATQCHAPIHPTTAPQTTPTTGPATTGTTTTTTTHTTTTHTTTTPTTPATTPTTTGTTTGPSGGGGLGGGAGGGGGGGATSGLVTGNSNG